MPAIKIGNIYDISRLNTEKIKFCLFTKTASCSFRQGLATEKCKTKAIQVDLGMFTYLPGYPDIFRHI